MYRYNDEGLNVYDSMYGTVTGHCSGKGVFILLDNGETAYATFGAVETGRRVLCTVLKLANDYWRALVSVDSVIFENYETDIANETAA